VAATTVVLAFGFAYAQQGPRGKTSYMPVDITEPFSAIFARLSAQKPDVTREHMALLNERYDLSDRPAAGVTMDRTKPVQDGVRVKLSAGKTWEALANMSSEQIRDQNVFPKGFYPLPDPKHQEGGFVFPHFLIDEIKRQEGRDLTRFDVEYDITRVNPSSHPYARARFSLTMRDSRPPAAIVATLGSADPDGADVVAAAPCNIVRVLSYGVIPQLRPLCRNAAGGLLARIAGNGVRTVIVETYRCGGRRASEGRQTYAEMEGGQELV
jgi:hypothetical protein